jgi:hypothetical protein
MIRTGALRDMDTIDLRQVESKSDLLTKFLVFINKDEQYALQRRYIPMKLFLPSLSICA